KCQPLSGLNQSHELVVRTPSGAKKWDYDIGGSPSGELHSPVVGSDGTIFIGSSSRLFALSHHGTNKWSADLWRSAGGFPAIAGDGTIYVSVGALNACSPAGSNLWFIGDFGGDAYGPPVIGETGKLYVPGPVNNSLHAIAPGGQPLWQTNLHALPFGYPTAPAIDAGGRIYYCASNSVWALNPQGQVVWKVTTFETTPTNAELANTSPTVGSDGTLYAAIGRTLYAIATGTNGPANSPWPMYRQNARHTGKVEKPALRQPQKRSDANFQFQLYGQLGQTFTVEATTNFNTWTSVTSIVANTLPTDVVDLSASNHPSRFYRASSPP
ncbi:MAG: PQQ-binding-like beta-propeller repeat protein, partial [Verrucomicrobia bacterium]|nr:PQQ-binding-like beta-propeller repeat protein [Verrucomicrobiota bacterium]